MDRLFVLAIVPSVRFGTNPTRPCSSRNPPSAGLRSPSSMRAISGRSRARAEMRAGRGRRAQAAHLAPGPRSGARMHPDGKGILFSSIRESHTNVQELFSIAVYGVFPQENRCLGVLKRATRPMARAWLTPPSTTPSPCGSNTAASTQRQSGWHSLQLHNREGAPATIPTTSIPCGLATRSIS